jgi:uncharacterized membrane protein
MRRRKLLATLCGGAPTAAVGSRQVTARSRTASDDTARARWLQDASGVVGQTQIEADRTRIELTLQPDGRANWQLALWTRLDGAEAASAFDSLERDIQSDPATVLEQFESRMNETVAAAAESTGREMVARSFTVTTETRALPQEYGLLVYQFVWDGFAVVDGSTLRAGEAIDGLLLESGTRLTVRWPERYELQSVDPEPDEQSDHVLAWTGTETDILSGQPRVVVSADADGGTETPLLVGGTLLGSLGVAGMLWWVHRRTDLTGMLDQRGDPAETAHTATETETEAETETGTGTTETALEPHEPDEPPAELLSNEERVLGLLEANGGRIKQQQVVAELDWTEAKTSQVVTTLRDEDAIEVFRIGRENVLSLPDESDI